MKRIVISAIFILLLPLIISGQGSKSEPEEKMEKDSDISEKIMTFSGLENARMTAEANPTVLFFHAAWCPNCKTALREIEARSGELGNIKVLIVDYDQNTELKKKYGVTYQHTYVQIDGEGEALAIWNGGGLSEILNNVISEEMN